MFIPPRMSILIPAAAVTVSVVEKEAFQNMRMPRLYLAEKMKVALLWSYSFCLFAAALFSENTSIKTNLKCIIALSFSKTFYQWAKYYFMTKI